MAKTQKKTTKKAGRRAKLTPKLLVRIVELLEGGDYFSVACRKVGITRQTGYNWREWGEAEEALPEGERTPYYYFYLAVEEAQANAEHDLLVKVKEGEKNWQAFMTILERRFPGHWGRWERKEQSGTVTLRVEYDNNDKGNSSPPAQP